MIVLLILILSISCSSEKKHSILKNTDTLSIITGNDTTKIVNQYYYYNGDTPKYYFDYENIGGNTIIVYDKLYFRINKYRDRELIIRNENRISDYILLDRKTEMVANINNCERRHFRRDISDIEIRKEELPTLEEARDTDTSRLESQFEIITN